jgi:Spy/CpxP family protein refolding chaperone
MNQSTLFKRLTVASCLVVCAGSLILTGCTDNSKPSATNGTTPATTSPAPQASGDTGTAANKPPATDDRVRPEQSGSNPLQLLQNPQVKAELKLTDDQITKIKAVETDLLANFTTASKSVKEEYKKIEALPKDKQEGEKKKLATKVEDGAASLAKDSKSKMSQILKPEQEKRAKEILLQKYDFGIVTKDDFATDLKLTDAQKKQLNDLVGQMRTKTIAAWEIPDKSDATKRDKTLADNRKRMEAVMTETNQQAKAVLTPEQLKTLETLKGKAVSFSLTDLK